MKLLYIENARIPTEKAHGYQIMKTCAALIKQGNDVTLVVPNRDNWIELSPFDYYGLTEKFPIERLATIDFLQRRTTFFNPLMFRLQRWTFASSLKRWLRLSHIPVDAIYTRDPYLAWHISKVSHHSIFLELHALPSARTLFRLTKVCGIVCVTDWLKRQVSVPLPDVPCTVIPDSVDLETFSVIESREEARRVLELDTNARYIVYGGRFSTMDIRKGLGNLDRAVAAISAQDPHIKLLLIGGSEQEFRALEGREPASTTTCLSAIPRSRLALYYRAADLLVMPFPNTSHYAYEMSPLKMFEYMASGTPILSSDLPSVREVLDEETCYFYPADEPEELQKAISSFFERSSSEREQKAVYARERVRRYTWENRASAIMNFIQVQL